MAKMTETYEGCDIEIEDNKKLLINDKEIEIEYEEENDTWLTRYLPYNTFNSLDELAKAIISNTSEFEAK